MNGDGIRLMAWTQNGCSVGARSHLDILETLKRCTRHSMRLDVAPFDNYDLRMALKYSIKRWELVDKILLGHVHW